MNWAIVAQLIITEGLPLAEALVRKWSTGTPPSPDDFADLRAASQQSAQDRMRVKLAQAGIPLDSTQAKILLGLTAPSAPIPDSPQAPV